MITPWVVFLFSMLSICLWISLMLYDYCCCYGQHYLIIFIKSPSKNPREYCNKEMTQ